MYLAAQEEVARTLLRWWWCVGGGQIVFHKVQGNNCHLLGETYPGAVGGRGSFLSDLTTRVFDPFLQSVLKKLSAFRKNYRGRL
jgi:hypothetical protein